MITAFRTVPIPGDCLSGIQQIKTNRLIIKLANPILHPVMLVMPWAKTVHGLTPTPAAMSKASPRPKRVRPITRKTTDTKGGVNVSAFGELHERAGTSFNDRKPDLKSIFDILIELMSLTNYEIFQFEKKNCINSKLDGLR
jgi:hypothetical protein